MNEDGQVRFSDWGALRSSVKQDMAWLNECVLLGRPLSVAHVYAQYHVHQYRVTEGEMGDARCMASCHLGLCAQRPHTVISPLQINIGVCLRGGLHRGCTWDDLCGDHDSAVQDRRQEPHED
jgi:hypothetical protein